MKKSTYIVILLLVFSLQRGFSQDEEIAKTKIEDLQSEKVGIKNAEREALKMKVERINGQLEEGLVSPKIADEQKKAAAELHAANINDRLVILDKKIDLLQRNDGLSTEDLLSKEKRFVLGLGHEDHDRYIGIFFRRKKPKVFKRDKRLYSDIVLTSGINYAFREGSSVEETGFSVTSPFYELGWAWRYRVLKNSNALRLNYGAIFQHNVVEFSKGVFNVNTMKKVEFYPNEEENGDARLVTENIVVQLHLETGPSKIRKTESSIRYSIRKQFRFGIGGFFGIPIKLRQRQFYYSDDLEIMELEANSGNEVTIYKETEYNFKRNNIVYGVSAYTGVGGFLLYAKYNLSSTFRNAVARHNNISLGIRFDM